MVCILNNKEGAMRLISFLVVFWVILFLSGCGRLQSRMQKDEIPDEAKQEIAKPIDCSMAQEDIQVLENEKVSSSDQLKSGVKMFVPASAAKAILKGQYLDRGMVATGQYNQDIDNKIKEIKSSCGIKE
jgi:Na+-transporting methylmalonyl-CoA/oxaloacetate decarboxylase gamma subunit